jgi:ketosteroid isomerase-like protein
MNFDLLSRWRCQMADKAFFQQMADQFGAAFNGGAAAQAACVYAEDAFVIFHDGQVVRGTADIAAFWTAQANRLSDLRVTVEDIRPIGENAVCGTLTSTSSEKSDGHRVLGNGLVVLERKGDEWKVVRHAWTEH